MDLFIKNYKVLLDPVLLKEGFKRKNKIYYRLINNELLQTMTYQRYTFSGFTINIGTWPACGENDSFSIMKSFNLRIEDFIGGQIIKYEKDDEESIKAGLNYVCFILNSSVIPFLNKMNKYETFLNELIKFEISLYSKELMLDYVNRIKFWTYLKLRDYNNVKRLIEYLANHIKQINEEAQEPPLPGYMKIPYVERKMPEEIVKISNAIDCSDTDYLDSLIKRNEENSWNIFRNELGFKV